MADLTTQHILQSGSIDELARTVSTDDQVALIRSVETSFDSLFTWDYGKGERQALNKLYEKAKVSQWNAETDIDWSITGQIEAARDPNNPLNTLGATDEGPFGKLNEEETATLGHAAMAWIDSRLTKAAAALTPSAPRARITGPKAWASRIRPR